MTTETRPVADSASAGATNVDAITQPALLVEEAAWEIANKGSAPRAIVARRFIEKHLVTRPARGITSGGHRVLDYAPIVRPEAVAP